MWLVGVASVLFLYLYEQTAEGNAQRQALALEHERSLPGVILASRKEFFVKMEDLNSLGNAAIIRAVRSLLMLVPTDARVVQDIETFGPQSGGGASEDSQEKPESAQTVLEHLFSTSGPSPTQLLYNLEVATCTCM